MAGRLRATGRPARRRALTLPALPWDAGVPPCDAFPADIFLGPVDEVARSLLGARLVSKVGGSLAEGVIVEVEAYGGATDPASHAAVKAGRTARNAAMFGPPGRAYVYRSYGVHWCLNVVTGSEGDAGAVLLRGLAPRRGEAVMTGRRGGRLPLAAGPGRLCQALAVDRSLNGHDLATDPLRLEPGWQIPDAMVGVSGRIGVARAAGWPFRFYVRGAPGVTPRGPADLPADTRA